MFEMNFLFSIYYGKICYENLLPMIRFDFNDRIHHIKNNLLHYHLNLDGIDLALLVFSIINFFAQFGIVKTSKAFLYEKKTLKMANKLMHAVSHI